MYTRILFYVIGFCSHLQQEQEKKHSEVEDLMGKIASLQAHNKKLLLQKNNFMADKTALEAEMEMTQKTNRFLFFHFVLHSLFSVLKFLKIPQQQYL